MRREIRQQVVRLEDNREFFLSKPVNSEPGRFVISFSLK